MPARKGRITIIPLTLGHWLCVGCLVFAWSGRAEEVIFHLRNGDRITGAITAENAQEVTVQSTIAGKINRTCAGSGCCRCDEQTSSGASECSGQSTASTKVQEIPGGLEGGCANWH
jgi:hypothetical protein